MQMLFTLLIAALAGMGVGSGGLFIVYLTLVAALEQYTAQALNLWFYLFAAGTAMVFHFQNRRLPIRRLLWLCGFGALGVFGGAKLAAVLSGGTLRTLFAGLLIAMGLASLRRKPAA